MELSFSKFETNCERIDWLLKKYPANEKQKEICNRLNVPSHLWSFYQFKRNSITKYWDSEVGRLISFFRPDKTQLDDRDVSLEEEIFIHHYSDINEYLEEFVMIYYSSSTLLDICRKRIQKLSIPRDPFIQKLLLEDVESPKFDLTKLRAYFYNPSKPLNNLFIRKDAVYSKEFVFWFQHEESLRDMFSQWNELRFIFMDFQSLRLNKTIETICLKCIKYFLDGINYQMPFYRNYHHTDSLKLKYIQHSFHWCRNCKRTPLFQILHKKDALKLYPKEFIREGYI